MSEHTTTRWLAAIMAAYALVALFTFGAAWHLDYREAHPKALVSTTEVNFLGASMAAIGWPLYWSVKIIGRVFFGAPMKTPNV
jgi:hypothetical protein